MLTDQYSRPSTLKSRIANFFYAEEVPYGLALLRIALPLVLLGVMLQRWPHSRELYSTDGAIAQLSAAYGTGAWMPEFSAPITISLHAALMFFLLCSAIGWNSKVSLWFSTILYTYFNLLDSLSSMTKYSVIACHLLLILSLSQCGIIWSVDSWLKKLSRKGVWPAEPKIVLPKSSAWPRRLVQLMIGYVYFGAAMTKIHTPAFFSGDQLRTWMVTEVNFKDPFGEYLAMFPAMITAFAYITIVWEVTFVFLAWKGFSRFLMIALGIGFHVGTYLFLGLKVFPLVCISAYLAFLNEGDMQWIFAKVRRLKRRWGIRSATSGTASRERLSWLKSLPLPSPAVFGIATLAVALVGLQVEHLSDPYGLRRVEGRHTLKELDPQLVAEMLGPETQLRMRDKFFSFEIGTSTLGGNLLDRRTEYRMGETAIVQCTLNPPHEDLWVECNLHDENDRVLERVGAVVSREELRSHFQYNLTNALPPGKYSLVLKSSGEEVSRRQFTLLPNEKSLQSVGN